MKNQQPAQPTLFDTMPGSPLFSGVAIKANTETFTPVATYSQPTLPFTCGFCRDTGQTSAGFCWCEAGRQAKSKFDTQKQAPTWPARISVRVPFTVDTFEDYTLTGQGAYPYECKSSKQYPHSFIYSNATGGWVASHQLQSIGGGRYIIK